MSIFCLLNAFLVFLTLITRMSFGGLSRVFGRKSHRVVRVPAAYFMVSAACF